MPAILFRLHAMVPGNLTESYKTPLGVHRIAKKIGDGCQSGEIIKARIPTGRLAEIIAEPRSGEGGRRYRFIR